MEGNQKNGVEKRVGNGWTPLYAKYVDILRDLFSRQIIMAKRDSTAWENSMRRKIQNIERVCGGKTGKNGLGRARYGKKQEQQTDEPCRGGNDVYR